MSANQGERAFAVTVYESDPLFPLMQELIGAESEEEAARAAIGRFEVPKTGLMVEVITVFVPPTTTYRAVRSEDDVVSVSEVK